MHDRVGDLEALLVKPLQDLQRHAHPRFRTGLAPGGYGFFDGRKQLLQICLRIRDAEVEAERRYLVARLADRSRLPQSERRVQARLEGGLALVVGGVAVDLGTG